MQKFLYRLIEDGTYCITGYLGDEAEVCVPDAVGETGCITVVYDKVFAGHSEITSVHLPDTVTDIGEFVFDGCTALAHLRLPSQLMNLWGHSFARCGITEITIPGKVKQIPSFAFKDCVRLKKVICSPDVKKIHPWAFMGCSQLKELVCGPDTEVSPEAFDSKEMKNWQKT